MHGIKLNTRDSRDICGKGIAGEVRSRSGEGSFSRALLEQQLDYHTHALKLQYLSSNSYKAVSGFISLPSEHTLQDYIHWTELHLVQVQQLLTG